jgi:hypothetical protein
VPHLPPPPQPPSPPPPEEIADAARQLEDSVAELVEHLPPSASTSEPAPGLDTRQIAALNAAARNVSSSLDTLVDSKVRLLESGADGTAARTINLPTSGPNETALVGNIALVDVGRALAREQSVFASTPSLPLSGVQSSGVASLELPLGVLRELDARQLLRHNSSSSGDGSDGALEEGAEGAGAGDTFTIFVASWQLSYLALINALEPGTVALSGQVRAALRRGNASIAVRNLSEPLFVSLPVDAAEVARALERAAPAGAPTSDYLPEYGCRYFDELAQAWRTDGCVVVSAPSAALGADSPDERGLARVVCSCDHLTDFIAVVRAVIAIAREGGVADQELRDVRLNAPTRADVRAATSSMHSFFDALARSPIAPAMLAGALGVYLACLFVALKIDRRIERDGSTAGWRRPRAHGAAASVAAGSSTTLGWRDFAREAFTSSCLTSWTARLPGERFTCAQRLTVAANVLLAEAVSILLLLGSAGSRGGARDASNAQLVISAAVAFGLGFPVELLLRIVVARGNRRRRLAELKPRLVRAIYRELKSSSRGPGTQLQAKCWLSCSWLSCFWRIQLGPSRLRLIATQPASPAGELLSFSTALNSDAEAGSARRPPALALDDRRTSVPILSRRHVVREPSAAADAAQGSMRRSSAEVGLAAVGERAPSCRGCSRTWSISSSASSSASSASSRPRASTAASDGSGSARGGSYSIVLPERALVSVVGRSGDELIGFFVRHSSSARRASSVPRPRPRPPPPPDREHIAEFVVGAKITSRAPSLTASSSDGTVAAAAAAAEPAPLEPLVLGAHGPFGGGDDARGPRQQTARALVPADFRFVTIDKAYVPAEASATAAAAFYTRLVASTSGTSSASLRNAAKLARVVCVQLGCRPYGGHRQVAPQDVVLEPDVAVRRLLAEFGQAKFADERQRAAASAGGRASKDQPGASAPATHALERRAWITELELRAATLWRGERARLRLAAAWTFQLAFALAAAATLITFSAASPLLAELWVQFAISLSMALGLRIGIQEPAAVMVKLGAELLRLRLLERAPERWRRLFSANGPLARARDAAQGVVRLAIPDRISA